MRLPFPRKKAGVLRVRKLADRTATPTPSGTYPFVGLKVVSAPPFCHIPTSFVTRGRDEGWLEVENPRLVERRGGPADEPWKVRHVFTHADAIVLTGTDGDVRYTVTRQPDKYEDGVEHFYGAKLDG